MRKIGIIIPAIIIILFVIIGCIGGAGYLYYSLTYRFASDNEFQMPQGEITPYVDNNSITMEWLENHMVER